MFFVTLNSLESSPQRGPTTCYRVRRNSEASACVSKTYAATSGASAQWPPIPPRTGASWVSRSSPRSCHHRTRRYSPQREVAQSLGVDEAPFGGSIKGRSSLLYWQWSKSRANGCSSIKQALQLRISDLNELADAASLLRRVHRSRSARRRIKLQFLAGIDCVTATDVDDFDLLLRRSGRALSCHPAKMPSLASSRLWEPRWRASASCLQHAAAQKSPWR
jgi:hypothetical protein